jgi:hypothetical protein
MGAARKDPTTSRPLTFEGVATSPGYSARPAISEAGNVPFVAPRKSIPLQLLRCTPQSVTEPSGSCMTNERVRRILSPIGSMELGRFRSRRAHAFQQHNVMSQDRNAGMRWRILYSPVAAECSTRGMRVTACPMPNLCITRRRQNFMAPVRPKTSAANERVLAPLTPSQREALP